MGMFWNKLTALFARLNCICGLAGLRKDNAACCFDLDQARRQRVQAQWERERCGL